MIKFNCGDNGSNYAWPGGTTAATITIKKMNSVAQ